MGYAHDQHVVLLIKITSALMCMLHFSILYLQRYIDRLGAMSAATGLV